MTIAEDLISEGWHLSNEGLELCSENMEKLTTSTIIKKALDMDLREIGENFLPEDLTKGKIDNIMCPGVVQIQKVKNASAPKYEYGSGAPPILRLLLTDGNNYINCLQWGHWKTVTMDTPPGTKIYLKPGKKSMQNNFLLLNENQFTVLGGCVAAMVEKWELCKQLASHIRAKENLDGIGPPPWIPFGRPIIGAKPTSKSGHFKSLEADAKDAKEDAVFKQQRQANIAEVSRVKEAKAKSFGGRKEKPCSVKPDYYMNSPYQQPNEYIEENEQKKFVDVTQDSPQKNKLLQNNKSRKNLRGEHLQLRQENARIIGNISNSQSTVKDNKLENRSKLGDFITNDLKQYSMFQGKATDSDLPYNNNSQKPQYKTFNKDFRLPFEKRQQKYEPSSKNLVNLMEQVKIYGYDARDSRSNISMEESSLKPGMEVMAKYWEDNQYYRAVIHAVGKEGKTCVVHFLDYGNYEEVLVNDVKERNWSAGPTLRGSYDNYPSLHAQNGTRLSNTGVKGYGRQETNSRAPKTEFRPSARIYQPPNRRDIQS